MTRPRLQRGPGVLAWATLTMATGVLTLSACGGGGGTLYQAKTKAAQLTVTDLPEPGWKPDSVIEGVTSTSTAAPFGGLTNLSAECKAAVTMVASDLGATAKAQTESRFVHGSDRLSTVVAAYDTVPTEIDDIPALVAKCPQATFTQMGSTVTMRLESPKYTNPGSTGLGVSIEATGQRFAMDLVILKRGKNLVGASFMGSDSATARAFLQQVINKADEKFAKAAG